ncbi:MAG: hypothetical protein C0501_13645 [Isosphaera sp.]|nr:hypothetical protein [Isosphaera sp.]
MPTIPVLLEPTPGGFRATTGAPLNLSAEAPTADEALAAVRGAYAAKLAAGAKVVPLDDPWEARLRELTSDMAANPMFDEWVAATKEYRRQREAEEDAAEAAAEAAEAARTRPAPQEPAA